MNCKNYSGRGDFGKGRSFVSMLIRPWGVGVEIDIAEILVALQGA